MKKEDAFYYECLLVLGFSAEYDEWFTSILESESPLSDIALKLTDCGSNVNKTISVLQSFRMDQSTDEAAVCNRLRLFLKDTYYSKKMGKSEVVSAMYLLASHIGDPGDFDMKLWGSMFYFEYYYSLAKDGILPFEKVDSAFFAYLDNGTAIDSQKLWESNIRSTLWERIKWHFTK
ncbi:MAG: hypothetical protein MJ101_05790 [Clostridia bacterium]|nr:hypothetical protein [Clostridia bacterium]